MSFNCQIADLQYTIALFSLILSPPPVIQCKNLTFTSSSTLSFFTRNAGLYFTPYSFVPCVFPLSYSISMPQYTSLQTSSVLLPPKKPSYHGQCRCHCRYHHAHQNSLFLLSLVHFAYIMHVCLIIQDKYCMLPV